MYILLQKLQSHGRRNRKLQLSPDEDEMQAEPDVETEVRH